MPENEIRKLVQKKARYYMHGFANTGSKYAITVGKKAYHSNDTAELVKMILKDKGVTK